MTELPITTAGIRFTFDTCDGQQSLTLHAMHREGRFYAAFFNSNGDRCGEIYGPAELPIFTGAMLQALSVEALPEAEAIDLTTKYHSLKDSINDSMSYAAP